jgi:probable phosphoglycerate mutase
VNLLLVRHAEPDTEHGPRPDPPLSRRGVDQASALGQWLAEEEVDAVYTSPLLRARQTAGYLSSEAVALDGLAEIGGTGEYVAAEDLRRNGDPRYAALIAGDLGLYGTDADTFRTAVVESIDHIVDRHRGETVAVVSHAGVINAYLGAHLGIEKRLIWAALDYASVTRVIANRDGVRTITALNEKASTPWPVGS